MEFGFASPLPVRVATGYNGEETHSAWVPGRRKKMKNLGLLCLALGLGKMGLGFSRLGFRSVGPGPGLVFGLSRLVLGSDFELNVIS
jgi:hypothetical protein